MRPAEPLIKEHLSGESARLYPHVHVDTAHVPAVGQAGGVLLAETGAVTGLGRDHSAGLAPWHKPTAVHDPGKVVADVAIALALGGDCLADVGALRAETVVYGLVASDATVFWTIAALASDATKVLAAINTARAAARTRAWALAVTGPQIMGSTRRDRWSSMWTRRWSQRTRTRRRPRRRSSVD